MKIYCLIAVFKDEKDNFIAQRVAEGEASSLRVDLDCLPAGTLRVAVMEKKQFELVLSEQNAIKNKGLGKSGP